jgi:multidrug efflux system membrane fusion protein
MHAWQAVAVFAFTIGGAAALAQTATGPQGGASAPVQSSGVPVQVAKAARQDVPVLFSNIGSVQAYNSVLVRARVDGTLDKVLFQEGQEVKPGDLLAEIDPRPYAAALAQAMAKKAADQAQLASAEKDLTRFANLAKDNFGTKQSVDQQQAQVGLLTANIQGDDANIATARLNLDFTQIKSPIEGRVGLRQVDPGNLIHATDTQGIVMITQIHPISVVFSLPQDDLPAVQAAMHQGKLPVYAASSDGKTQLAQGTLETIDNMVDQTTGTFKLKATFPNQDDRLWPGQFVNVSIRVQTMKDVVTVPSAAVQRGPNGLYAYVVKPDSTVAMQGVEVAQDNGTTAVIAKGLDAGTTVVVNGQSRLQNGTRVALAGGATG